VNRSAEALDSGVDGGADENDGQTGGSVLAAAPDAVEVRRNAGVSALVGVAASGVAIAYLSRAAQTGAVLDWLLVVLMGALGAFHLRSLVDARTPLLVADTQGVRIRLGRAWHGIPWGALASVEHTPRRGVWHDGRLVLVPHSTERVLSELDGAGRRQGRLAERLYGAPFALPLGLSTRVSGAGDDLTVALRELAGSAARVVELVDGETDPATSEVEIVEPEPREGAGFRFPDPRPALAAAIGALAGAFTRTAAEEPEGTQDQDQDRAPEPDDGTEPTVPIVASPTPAPLRDPRGARRAEVRAEVAPEEDAPSGRELRRPGSVNLVEDTQVWGDRVRPISRAGDAVDPLVIDDFAVEPAPDPVIGPDLAAARTRLGLTVDQLAERTRIRPHVIESIEVDDFAPCGGDFYARGHLRTLARVLGQDAAPLLTAYDQKYADAPIDPRRVFEAELAGGANGSIRMTRGGPNWSVLIAAIMTLVLAWSIARLVMDTPVELHSPAPVLNGSGGPQNLAPLDDPIKVRLTGVEGGSHVEVRDVDGEVVLSQFLAEGKTKRVEAVPPVTVVARDAGSIKVNVDGDKKGLLGEAGKKRERTFRAAD
jgi:hypothetical protein